MTNREELDLIHDKYEDKLTKLAGLSGRGETVGCGTYGCAYGYNDKVLKLTLDDSEAQAAARLLRAGGNHWNVYKIFNVYKLKSAGVYAIIQERLFEASEDINYVSNIIAQTFIRDDMSHYYKELFYKYRGIEHFKKFFARIIKEDGVESIDWEIVDFLEGMDIISRSWRTVYSDEEAKKIMIREIGFLEEGDNDYFDIFDQIASGVAWLYKNGIKFYDIHDGNIMQKDSDTPVIIDLGVSRVEGDYDIKILEGYIKGVISDEK